MTFDALVADVTVAVVIEVVVVVVAVVEEAELFFPAKGVRGASLLLKGGTLGVLTGNIGELVLDREPKNLKGFSGDIVARFF